MGLKSKVLYCYNCRKNTVHKLVGHESMLEGTGPARVIAAVFSLGTTETILADWHYQCQCCGEIKTK